jgi:hypothetical protein
LKVSAGRREDLGAAWSFMLLELGVAIYLASG